MYYVWDMYLAIFALSMLTAAIYLHFPHYARPKNVAAQQVVFMIFYVSKKGHGNGIRWYTADTELLHKCSFPYFSHLPHHATISIHI